MTGVAMLAATVAAATTVFPTTGGTPDDQGVTTIRTYAAVLLLCAAFHIGMALIIRGVVRRGR
uniref:Uncharacterized protein n=1 Tax=Leersia perrieri TaxID=77586 RepID=A0A0D9X516_9ORYZ